MYKFILFEEMRNGPKWFREVCFIVRLKDYPKSYQKYNVQLYRGNP